MDIKAEAIKLFNETWDLLDKTDRTDDDKRLMLHKTHTSFYLWTLVGEMVNYARGEWQVSHVYAVLGEGDLALLHGQKSLDLCLEHGFKGLDLAFGYEAVARAYAVLGDIEQAKVHKDLGLKACETIDNKQDRDYAKGEINGIVI